MHVVDFASAVHTVMIKSKNYNIYNIKGKFKIKIILLINLIAKISKKVSDFAVYIKDRPFNDLEYNVEDKKIRKLGWSEKFDFKTEIKKLLTQNLILK